MSDRPVTSVLPLKYAAREKIPRALMARAVIFATVVYCALQGVGTAIVVLIPMIFYAGSTPDWLMHVTVSGVLVFSHLSVAAMGLAWLNGNTMAEPLWVPLGLNVAVRLIAIFFGLFKAAGPTVLAPPTPVRELSLIAVGGYILHASAGLVLPLLAIWVLRRPELRHGR